MAEIQESVKINAKVAKPSLTSSKCSKSTTLISNSAETQESMVLQARAQTQTQLSFQKLIFQN
jgi:hypothetical protein